MDSRGVFTTLSDHKADISLKLKLCTSLVEDTEVNQAPGKEQFIFDWVFTNINHEIKVGDSVSTINNLLAVLDSLLKNISTANTRLHFKSFVYEVLTKCMKHSSSEGESEPIDKQLVAQCGCYVMKHEDGIMNKRFAQLSDLLAATLTHSTQLNASQALHPSLLSFLQLLVSGYHAQVKTQFNIKKVFTSFCNSLLVPLLLLRSKLRVARTHPGTGTSDKLINTISHTIETVVCNREPLQSLQQILSQKRIIPAKETTPSEDEPPAKKSKPEETTSTKKNKLDDFFNVFFQKIQNAAKNTEQVELLRSEASHIYKMFISSARRKHILNPVEHFDLLQSLLSAFESKDAPQSTHKLSDWFLNVLEVVRELNVYSRSDDATIGSAFYKWMLSVGQQVVSSATGGDGQTDGQTGEQTDGQTTNIALIRCLLRINHNLLDSCLPEICLMCLDSDDGDTSSDDTSDGEDDLLTEILITYNKAHQLDHFMSSLLSDPCLSKERRLSSRFVTSFAEICSSLNRDSTNALLSMITERLVEAHPGQFLPAFLIHQLSLHAPVLPLNGYTNNTLQLFIQQLVTLKTDVVNQASFTAEVRLVLDYALLTAATLLAKHDLIEEADLDTLTSASMLTSVTSHMVYQLVKKATGERGLESLDMAASEDEVNGAQVAGARETYLKICISFARFKLSLSMSRDTLPQDEYDLGINLVRMSLNYDLSTVHKTWNGNLFDLSASTLVTAQLSLLQCNMGLILEGGRNSIALTAIYMGKRELLKELELFCYNNQQIQTYLVGSLLELEGVKDVVLDIETSTTLSSILDGTIQMEQTTLSPIVDACVKSPVQADLEHVNKIIAKLQSIRICYLREPQLFAFTSVTLAMCNQQNIQLMSSLLDSLITSILSSNHSMVGRVFPVEYIIGLITNKQQTDNYEQQQHSLLSNLSRIMVNYLRDEDMKFIAVQWKITESNEENIKLVQLCKVILATCAMILDKTVVRDRCLHNVYHIATLCWPNICAMVQQMKERTDTSNEHLVACFSHVCGILLHAETKGKSSQVEAIKANIVDVFNVITETCQTFQMNDKESLHLLTKLYSSSVDPTTTLHQLRANSTVTETQLVTKLLENLKTPELKDGSLSFLTNLMETTDGLEQHLHLVFASWKSSDMFSVDDMTTHTQLWSNLLDLKIEKEKRKPLWDLMPKVMFHLLGALNQLSNSSTSSSNRDIIACSIFKLLVTLSHKSKNSPVSHCTSSLLHTFGSDQHVAGADRFHELFELKYQLLSSLLFHHTPSVYPAIAAYLSSVNGLLLELVTFNDSASTSTKTKSKPTSTPTTNQETNKTPLAETTISEPIEGDEDNDSATRDIKASEQDGELVKREQYPSYAPVTSESHEEVIAACAERLSRLYTEIAKHKATIVKYTPYIISNYIRACQQTNFPQKVKTLLDSGIWCVMDTCEAFEYSLMLTTLVSDDKETFKLLVTGYNKHHKFDGKT